MPLFLILRGWILSGQTWYQYPVERSNPILLRLLSLSSHIKQLNLRIIDCKNHERKQRFTHKTFFFLQKRKNNALFGNEEEKS